MSFTSLETNTSLCVTCDLREVSDADEKAVFVHGVCHSPRCFDNLADELNARNISCALISLQSEHAGKYRNCIGINEYAQGLNDAVTQLRRSLHWVPDFLVGHSMGGRLIQKVQNKDPHFRLPTVLMAPIPLQGISPMLMRYLWNHPQILLKTLSGDLRDAMKDPEDIRTLFGDADTPREVLEMIANQIRHTSYRAYLELLWPQRIRKTGKSTLLLESDTDGLFPEGSYDNMEKHYPLFERKCFSGGHDFFVEHADVTADAIIDHRQRHRRDI
jgi:pimeloyl-ACP methyl ester carboxylesterase